MSKPQTDQKWKNIRRYRRATQAYKIKIKKDGVAIDITDWTLYFTLKANMNDKDNDAVIDKKITIHSDPTNGESLITFTASEMDRVGTYYYSVDYKDDEGNEDVLVHGRMEFEDTVRKARD